VATRVFVTFSGVGAGSGLLDAPGAQESLMVSLYPQSGGVPKSGRNYVPFLSADNHKQGQILSAKLGAIETAMTAIYITALILTAVGQVVAAISKIQVPPLPWITEPVVARVVRPVLSTQRRRVVHHQTTIT